MTETEFLQWLMSKAEALPLLVLVVWAEVRFLPLVLDAIGWNRAVAAKLEVTEADARAHRPAGLLERFFRRPPNGGPPAAAVVLLISVALLASGRPDRESARMTPRSHGLIRMQPAGSNEVGF